MKVSVTQTSHQASQRHWKPSLCVSASEMPPSLRLLLKAVSRRAANEHSCRPRPLPVQGVTMAPSPVGLPQTMHPANVAHRLRAAPGLEELTDAHCLAPSWLSTRMLEPHSPGQFPASSCSCSAPGAPTSFLLLPGKWHPQPHCLRTPPPHPSTSRPQHSHLGSIRASQNQSPEFPRMSCCPPSRSLPDPPSSTARRALSS